jgi:hypothetical protein
LRDVLTLRERVLRRRDEITTDVALQIAAGLAAAPALRPVGGASTRAGDREDARQECARFQQLWNRADERVRE